MNTCIISPNVFFIIISISSICSNSTIFSVYLSKCIVMWKRLAIQTTCHTFHFDKIHSAPAIRFSKPNAISLHSYTTNIVNYDNIINLFIHDHTLFCDECEDRR
ncbi:hypothetical protein PRUPE_4G145400 [Prunus persica]|uniref:Uncharacterized protein n=1 Tax=Prunus persica TaxID=3760 RepID=A0A251PNU4_PRUPE|nr:hypothetical protein PRUPE_4G145400 [Prunus persica]